MTDGPEGGEAAAVNDAAEKQREAVRDGANRNRAADRRDVSGEGDPKAVGAPGDRAQQLGGQFAARVRGDGSRAPDSDATQQRSESGDRSDPARRDASEASTTFRRDVFGPATDRREAETATIRFERGQSRVTDQQMERLLESLTDEQRRALQDSSNEIVVRVSASRLGDAETNQRLTEQRKESIEDWLEKKGVKASVMSQALGEQAAEAAGKSERSDDPEDRVALIEIRPIEDPMELSDREKLEISKQLSREMDAQVEILELKAKEAGRSREAFEKEWDAKSQISRHVEIDAGLLNSNRINAELLLRMFGDLFEESGFQVSPGELLLAFRSFDDWTMKSSNEKARAAVKAALDGGKTTIEVFSDRKTALRMVESIREYREQQAELLKEAAERLRNSPDYAGQAVLSFYIAHANAPINLLNGAVDLALAVPNLIRRATGSEPIEVEIPKIEYVGEYGAKYGAVMEAGATLALTFLSGTAVAGFTKKLLGTAESLMSAAMATRFGHAASGIASLVRYGMLGSATAEAGTEVIDTVEDFIILVVDSSTQAERDAARDRLIARFGLMGVGAAGARRSMRATLGVEGAPNTPGPHHAGPERRSSDNPDSRTSMEAAPESTSSESLPGRTRRDITGTPTEPERSGPVVERGRAGRYGEPEASGHPNRPNPEPKEKARDWQEVHEEATSGADRGEDPDVHDVRTQLHPRSSGSNKPSTLLGEALVADKKPRVPGFQAHHIIPVRLHHYDKLSPDIQRRVVELHDWLNDAGIKLNDASNGVWLPKGRETANQYGRNLHLDQIHEDNVGYILELDRRLRPVKGDAVAFRAELAKIRLEMASGRFDFPRNPNRK